MLLEPVSLYILSKLREPSEKVPLGEEALFREAAESPRPLKKFEMKFKPQGSMDLSLTFEGLSKPVHVYEKDPGGELYFECAESGKDGSHVWQAWNVLYRCVHDAPQTEVEKNLTLELEDPMATSVARARQIKVGIASDTMLESVTIICDERPSIGGQWLEQLFNHDMGRYRLQDLSKDRDSLAPHLWNMPEVFRRNLVAYAGHYQNEVSEQKRIAGILRYNFSNGMQLSAQDILRHPTQKFVPSDVLPAPHTQTNLLHSWPLLKDSGFVSQNLRELADIMQLVLVKMADLVNRHELKLYLENSISTEGVLVRRVEFVPQNDLHWRVEFKEDGALEAEFKLLSYNKEKVHFFETMAFAPESKTLYVFPWGQEFSYYTAKARSLEPQSELDLSAFEVPTLNMRGELQVKSFLRVLRKKNFKVELLGETFVLDRDHSVTEVHLDKQGFFQVFQQARIPGHKDLHRRGWSSRVVLFMRALSEGLTYLHSADAKEIAGRSRSKRDWDLRLLKHLGVLQYLTFETLHHYFYDELSDGLRVDDTEIFTHLQEKVRSLLVAGSTDFMVRDQSLADLCSKSVLVLFEDYISRLLKSLSGAEAYYFEHGEIILEGVHEREFRLLYELLRQSAVQSGGDVFKKARSPFLARHWTGELAVDPQLIGGSFHFSLSKKDELSLHDSIESLQGLIPHGYVLYFNEQKLQEISEDDFRVEFFIHSEMEGRNLNWFELNPKFFLNGQEIDPQQMGSFGGSGVIEYEGKLFLVPQKQMPSMRRLENFWKKLQKGKKEASKKRLGESYYHLPKHQVLELLALRASGVGIRGDEEWRKLCDFYDNMGKESQSFAVPPSVTAELKAYQLTGVKWLHDLYNLKLGALLADDMGLGKTLQTLAFLEMLRVRGELGQVLIVVPSSLIYNWQQEIEKFTPQLPLQIFTSKEVEVVGRQLESKKEGLIITTYGLLMEHEDFLNQYTYQVLIFDEAQNLKNISTKRTGAARSLNARFKICLTGTPMENHYGEFYSLVDLLVPGSLGRLEEFKRQFVNTEIVAKSEVADLKLKIKPLLMRRTKKEILDQLPEKQEKKVSIAFEERQMEIYRDIALAYNHRVQESIETQGSAQVQLQMLTALLRLRQACSDPGALPNVKYEKTPPKLEALMESVQEIVEAGESALVFTQFIQTLERTVALLKAAQIPVFVLHGGVSSKQRQKTLADFNNMEGGAVLVMTLKTGGVGLNLTKASYVFHLEPWWNPSVENQATDRAHRLGQKKAVQVFRYIMHESLEEKIELLKSRKDLKFQSLFSNTESAQDLDSASGALTKEDFDLLLGLR